MIIPEEGKLLLVDKPKDWTSFDVVNKLRYLLKVRKIGHAGTLDPLATGLLLVGVGKYTKKLNELQGLDKMYDGIIELGKTTPSFDLETAFDSECDVSEVEEQNVLSTTTQFVGNILQIPPVYSAVKVGGERAYKKARKNEVVKMAPRTVTIQNFEITKIQLPEVYFSVHCSKGTYIRSLASDFGQALGVGGYLKQLRRTKIGEYSIGDAYKLKDLIDQIDKESSENN
jgi:tRNA pseudouridine55 synthase